MKKIHPLNKALSLFGLQVTKVNGAKASGDGKEKEFKKEYDLIFERLKGNPRGFEVSRAYRYQVGEHPKSQQHLEFEFAASHLYKEKPSNILDIGSYREFIIGLLAHYDVTTIDIRERKSLLSNETVVTCDAKALKFPNDSFEAVLTLECLPHIGMGRYGDEFDLNGDLKAFKEMVRVLKPGGIIIFSAAITRGRPSIAWNARRNYSYEMIKGFCQGLVLAEEKFIDRRNVRFCEYEELTTDPTFFDYYIGCWRKEPASLREDRCIGK